MTQNFTHDFIVIGGGSGGLASARRAAQHGAKVALIEKGALGGTCVNLGCVPKKVMYNAASILEAIKHAEHYHIKSSNEAEINFPEFVAKRHKYIEKLNGIYLNNLKNDGVEFIQGTASFLDKNTVIVDGKQSYCAQHILIATGGRPTLPDIEGSELGISSDGFFALESLPKKVIIVGSGYIATETAGVLNALGSEVEIVVRGDAPIRDFDRDISLKLKEYLIKDGIKFNEGFITSKALKDGDKLSLISEDHRTIDNADCIIWAIGRTPNTRGLQLERCGVELDSAGYIKTDDWEKTTAEGIYALGDVNGKIELTPVAIAAGRKLAERLFNHQSELKQDYSNVPSVMFTHPPIGSCGMSEEEANSRYPGQVKCYRSQFNDMYYAMIEDKTPTFMKLVTVGSDEKIVGIHTIGRSSDEMIQGFAVALKMGATKKDFDACVAIHPTASEEFVTMR